MALILLKGSEKAMKARSTMKNVFTKTVVWVLVFLISLPAGVFAQGLSSAPLFRQEELEQMLAPIALYPDPLLVQMLMAATYPLEVVEAARWVNANPNLTGDQLAYALEQKPWDPSVKSLANFPNALAMLDGNIEWTQRLGDAFLAQKDQVMDTVQSLRGRAQAQGNLNTTEQQIVTSQDNMIAIEPANPEVIYVPTYNPSVVYGAWPYSDYPPYYYYPPGYVIGDAIGGILSFGVGLALGAAWWGWAWGGFDWYNHGVYCTPYYPYYNPYYGRVINSDYIKRHRYANGTQPGPGSRREWTHDPTHRRNVGYRDAMTRERYGQQGRVVADIRKEYRGNAQDGRTPGTRIGDRPNIEQRRDSIGRERAAFDGRNAASMNNRSATERRITPQTSGRTAVNRINDNHIVVEPLGTQQRRNMVGPAPQQAQTRPNTTSAFRGPTRPSYQGQSTMSSSFRGYDGANPSDRSGGMANYSRRAETMRPPYQGSGMANPSRRVETVNPSYHRDGTWGSSRQGEAMRSPGFGGGLAGGDRGGFFSGNRGSSSGRSGGFGGGSIGRSGGFGGGSIGRSGGFGGRG